MSLAGNADASGIHIPVMTIERGVVERCRYIADFHSNDTAKGKANDIERHRDRFLKGHFLRLSRKQPSARSHNSRGAQKQAVVPQPSPLPPSSAFAFPLQEQLNSFLDELRLLLVGPRSACLNRLDRCLDSMTSRVPWFHAVHV